MSKELLNFMTWVNQDEKLGYTSIGIERIVNRYITSKDLIIDEAYENYKKEIIRQREAQKKHVEKLRSQGKRLKVTRIELLTKDEFINKCKTDLEFSENWGLTIEERELSLEERLDLLKKLEIFQERVIDNAKSEMIHSLADSHSIPTKLITITYNDTKIESYE
jgi:hypothetical protein